MIIPFWEQNLNPITLEKRETTNETPKPKVEGVRYTTKDLKLDPEYISAEHAKIKTGLGAKAIKNKIHGFVYRSKFGGTFYLRSDIEYMLK